MPTDIRFTQTCPILRMFDQAQAGAFYLAYLGFTLDWEHRFGDAYPLYTQISRAGLILHLSEHHGDASPGATIVVRMAGIEAYLQELTAKDYPFSKPAIENQPWGRVMTLTDPFSNRIRFLE